MTSRTPRIVLGAIGAVITLTGLIWTLQGLGMIPGSFMTGNRTWLAEPSTADIGERGPNNPIGSRPPDCAPLRTGVKAKPATRVDLRSSLDPDPSPAFARTQPETRRNRSQPEVDTAPLLQG